MLDRSHDVAGALVVEVPWQELAVAAGVALWWYLRMFDLQWPRGLRRPAALAELLLALLSGGG